jgi:hypothetical protein
MPLYTVIHSLLNVLVQIANNGIAKKNISEDGILLGTVQLLTNSGAFRGSERHLPAKNEK